MSDIVFILGAGASKEAGAPLMNEFLDVSRNLLEVENLGTARNSFQKVFEAIGALQRVHSKAQLDIQNIESIFAAFEMAKTLEAFPDRLPDDIDDLIKALKTVIVETLIMTIKLDKQGQRVHPPASYTEFVELLTHLKNSATPRKSVSVLTLNYDMGLDYALHLDICMRLAQ